MNEAVKYKNTGELNMTEKTTKKYRETVTYWLTFERPFIRKATIRHAGGKSPKMKVELSFDIGEGTKRFDLKIYTKMIEQAFEYAANRHDFHTFTVDHNVIIESNSKSITFKFTATPSIK